MLIKALENISSCPFHMPGHKRRRDLFDIDFTEIPETDDLHDPKGILKDCMDFAANVYKTKKTYFLINGSTCGILAAIGACVQREDKILIARNCHKSVYNAIYLNGLDPVYICPPILECGLNGSIDPTECESLIKKHRPKALVMVSPTYEGIVSDIGTISEICHKNDCILIVDEAHGAHFCFHRGFPVSAADCGADIVIQSLHKTLPSLTQTALLHICSDRTDTKNIQKYLSIFQSSSPSYVLMGSIDGCIRYMTSEKGRAAVENYYNTLIRFRKKAAPYILSEDIKDGGSCFDVDISKIIIHGGRDTADILRKNGIEPEMTELFYTIALSSVGDTEESFHRLLSALHNIKQPKTPPEPPGLSITEPKIILTPYKASLLKTESVPLKSSIGRISAATAYIYPPGIPIINPGELITPEITEIIESYLSKGFSVTGITNSTIKTAVGHG